MCAAAENAAASAVMAQWDFRHAMLRGETADALVFLGEMRAYREMAGALIAICRETLEVA
jgi:hypothetical protein